MSSHREALARTSLLLSEEWFAGRASQAAIADALLQSTVRLVADERSVLTRAGQSALVSAFMLTARLGIGIELDVANVPVIDRQAPLRCALLADALLDLGADLIPGARVSTTGGDAQECFLFGSSQGPAGSIRVLAGSTCAELVRDGERGTCEGALPYGGFAAGAAVAAVALEAALPAIAQASALEARRMRPSPGPPMKLDLRALFPGLGDACGLDLGELDAVSGGAITHATLYCLLRVPGVRASIRVIEAQHADPTNLNRYSLLRASAASEDKIAILARAGSERIRIDGVTTLFTKETRAGLQPLAPRVLVGVDDIRARWWVAESEPAWMAVGASSNNVAQLTVHTPASPCAGCLHPVAVEPQTIPTISFVSFWAGVLQCCALVTGSSPVNICVSPFALGERTPMIVTEPRAAASCPVGCAAAA